MSYSQGQEEAVILEYFGDSGGKFIDIGANDGKTFSNTRALAGLGWTGVLVEPTPKAFVALQEEYKNYENCHLVCAALDVDHRMLKFYEAEDNLLSSSVESHVQKWESKAGQKFKVIGVPTLTWDDIFFHYEGPFRFVSIDAEGVSLGLFYAFPIEAARPDMIVVEHDGDTNARAIVDYSKKFGYEEKYRDGNNIIIALKK